MKERKQRRGILMKQNQRRDIKKSVCGGERMLEHLFHESRGGIKGHKKWQQEEDEL